MPWKRLREGPAPPRDTLIAFSASVACLFRLFNTFFPDYWHERGTSKPHTCITEVTVLIVAVWADAVYVFRFLPEELHGEDRLANIIFPRADGIRRLPWFFNLDYCFGGVEAVAACASNSVIFHFHCRLSVPR